MMDDWSRSKIKDIVNTSSGGTPSRKNPDYYNGTIPWVKTGELKNKYLSDTEEHITEEAVKNSSAKLFPKSTILIAMYGATIGNSSILTNEATTNQACCALLPNEKVHHEFLFYKFSYEKNKVIALGAGGAQPNISQKILNDYEIYYPTDIKEQQKIAAILSSVDEAIEKTEQIIEQTETVKKGLMQKLLTKGIGHTEFKKTIMGNIPSIWEITKFKNVCKIVSGQVDPKEKPYSDMLHVGNANIEKFTGRLLECKTALEEGQISGKYLFNENHILYGKINPHFAKVSYPEFEGVCSADIYPIEPDKSILPKFLMYLLLSNRFISYTTSVSGRTGIPKVNRNDLEHFLIVIPSIKEQKKIIQLLDSTNDKIEKSREKLINLQNIKQGLMQQLLTGKTRVNVDDNEEVLS